MVKNNSINISLCNRGCQGVVSSYALVKRADSSDLAFHRGDVGFCDGSDFCSVVQCRAYSRWVVGRGVFGGSILEASSNVVGGSLLWWAVTWERSRSCRYVV